MSVALLTERLLAVKKDRKAMEQRVRDDARQMGRSFNDIKVSYVLYFKQNLGKVPGCSVHTSSVCKKIIPTHNGVSSAF